MTISHEYILTLQKLKGFGPKKIEQVAGAIARFPFMTIQLDDFYNLLVELKEKGKFKGLSGFPEYYDIEQANHTAHRIIMRSEDLGIKMVSRFDKDFPKNLLQTVNEKGKLDVPTLLFYKGDLSITQRPAIAIIGTREPSLYGVKAGELFGKFFASRGFNIVSGLALGCDSAGHRGALKAEGGVTTAFLAHGLDIIYPPENETLAEEIVANGGLLMTEYSIGEHVNRNYLVNRDRLQAALADATLVIQTGIKGGTMHAVNATLVSGKTVYAVDYNVPIPEGKDDGNRWLLRNRKALPLQTINQEEVISRLLKVSRKDSTSTDNLESDSNGPHESNYPKGTLFNN